jgi:hypothetical protein
MPAMKELRSQTAVVGLACAIVLLTGACRAGIAVDGLVHERLAQPGETYRGAVTVRNAGNEPVRARLYQTDYLFFSDGSNTYGSPGSVERSNAGWVTLSSNYVEVPPNGSAPVEYVAVVPADGTLLGSYWSLVMVEELVAADPEDSPENAGAGEMRAAVGQIVRYGIHIVTHIGETGSREVMFTDKALVVTDDGARVLHVDVENVGERSLRPYLWVELHDSAGGRVDRFESDRRRLYPGTSVRYAVDLTGARSGSYQALVVVDNGDEHVFGAQYGLEF